MQARHAERVEAASSQLRLLPPLASDPMRSHRTSRTRYRRIASRCVPQQTANLRCGEVHSRAGDVPIGGRTLLLLLLRSERERSPRLWINAHGELIERSGARSRP